ncbi:MAG: CDP-alcohol phosphatidyltransferase family protein [Anaerolineae bacterium]|nr:CDP-alcohol phosphatidyltransferase family protein [Anaerolineae bacterium]
MSSFFQRQQLANMISLSRLGFLPFIVLAGLQKQPEACVGLFAAQLFLDAVDGFVARRLHIESDLGRRLDTVIDLAIWLPSMALFVWLVWDEFARVFPVYPHLFIIPTITSALMYITAYHYLHTVAAIHLYSGKLASALVLLLMVTMLLDRFHPLLGYLTACTAVVYHLEAMTIYFLKKDRTDENVTSLLQVFRSAH